MKSAFKSVKLQQGGPWGNRATGDDREGVAIAEWGGREREAMAHGWQCGGASDDGDGGRK